MNTHTRLLQALALSVALAALFTISFARPARLGRDEGNPRRRINALPPVGIAAGQTLHVTFLNTGDNPFEIIPCVLDGQGEDIKEGTSLTIEPGQMRSFEVSRSEIVTRFESRLQVRAVAHVHKSDLKNLVVTGEVIEEETGRSSLFVPGLRVGFDPQPDPPSPN